MGVPVLWKSLELSVGTDSVWGLLMTDVQFHPTVSSISFVLNRVFDFMEINQVQCDLRISSLSDTWTHFGAEPPTAFVQVLGVMNEHVIVL